MNIVLPTNRDENWRYANLRPLTKAAATPAPRDAAAAAIQVPPALEGYEHFVFVDGHLVAGLSSAARPGALWLEPRGSQAGDAMQALLDGELGHAGVDFALARANLAHGGDVFMIYPPATGEAMNVQLTFIATQGAARGTAYPRIQVHAPRSARLNLVERHLSAGQADSLTNAAIDVGIAPGACVSHVRLQDYANTASSFDTLVVNVGDSGTYRLRAIAMGAAASRSTAFIRLAGRGARCELSAAAIANGTQTHDMFAEVDHAAPETATREIFRGIANDRGKLAFNGKMIVRENAHGADSDQSLKSLLTGSGAEAAARPQLEIYTDKVTARHGATTGKIDDQMLFYLLSRGIDRATAHSLLEWAFIEDAVSQVEPAALRREIENVVAARLRAVASLGLLEARS